MCFSINTIAQEGISFPMGDHTAYYSVFNSSIIPPKTAAAYGLPRAGNRVYVNIAVVSNEGGLGKPAIISGVARNLMQQRFDLEFVTIDEGKATYYLAPMRFTNEDILHFDITTQVDANSPKYTFTFTKKLYVD